MDENKLRWITLVVIIAVGASYMLWLAVTYTRFQQTDNYVRKFLDERFPAKTEETGEQVSES